MSGVVWLELTEGRERETILFRCFLRRFIIKRVFLQIESCVFLYKTYGS